MFYLIVLEFPFNLFRMSLLESQVYDFTNYGRFNCYSSSKPALSVYLSTTSKPYIRNRLNRELSPLLRMNEVV